MTIFLKKYNGPLMVFLIWGVITGLGCDTLRAKRTIARLSVERAEKDCPTPLEFYAVPSMSYGLEVTVMRHRDCMGVPDLLMVLWSGENDELNFSIAKIIALMYFKSMEVTDHRYLKVGTSKERPTHIIFYEIDKAK